MCYKCVYVCVLCLLVFCVAPFCLFLTFVYFFVGNPAHETFSWVLYIFKIKYIICVFVDLCERFLIAPQTAEVRLTVVRLWGKRLLLELMISTVLLVHWPVVFILFPRLPPGVLWQQLRVTFIWQGLASGDIASPPVLTGHLTLGIVISIFFKSLRDIFIVYECFQKRT